MRNWSQRRSRERQRDAFRRVPALRFPVMTEGAEVHSTDGMLTRTPPRAVGAQPPGIAVTIA